MSRSTAPGLHRRSAQEAREAPGQAGRALVWSLANTVVGRFGTLAIGIALARLLGPAEFGTYAVAFVALMAILSFNELGVSLAIVRWQDDPASIAPTVNAISIAMSAVLTVLAVLAAPWFAATMGDPAAAPLVQLLSLCVLINGAVATPAALLQRAFRQDQRMVADQVNTWVGAFVSVGLAASGVGALALVVGRLAGAGLSGLLLVHYSPLPYRLALDRAHVRPLLAFGLPLAASSVIVFLVGFLDQLVVGHVLGAVMLGFYVLAFNLSSWPVSMFSQPLRSVAPAMFARLQHDPVRMRSSFLRVLRVLTIAALPSCAVLAVTADDAVRLVYGRAWAPAAGVLEVLAVLAAVRILFELAYDFLVVAGRSRSILLIQLVWILTLLPAVWWGVERWGIRGAAVALVVVSVVVSAPMYLAQFRSSGFETSQLLRATSWGVGCAVLTAVVAALVVTFVASALLTLLSTGAVLLLVVAGGLWVARADLAVFRERGTG